MFYYWITVTAIIVIVNVLLFRFASRRYGRALAEFCRNNNWWPVFSLGISILLFFSAIFANFGEPILGHTSRKAVNHVKAYAKEVGDDVNFQKAMKYLFLGNGDVQFKFKESLVPEPSLEKEEEKEEPKYASWWHWPIFFIFFLFTPILIPFVYLDELKAAWASALKKMTRRVSTGSSTGASPTAPTTGGKSGKGWTWYQELLWEFVGEAIMKIFAKLSTSYGNI